MEHYTYLKRLLKPMFLYDPDGIYTNAELAALGGELDGACAGTDDFAQECVVPLASGPGLAAYEALLPDKPAFVTLADRRNAIMALLQIDETSFTEQALNAALAGCGIAAQVREGSAKYEAIVTFPGVRGRPADFDRLKTRIEAILPCHLDIQYRFDCLTWKQLESVFASWSALESGPADWDALEGWEIE